MWNRVLSPDEVAQLESATLPNAQFVNGQKAYYPLDRVYYETDIVGERVLDQLTHETAPLAGDAQLVVDPTRPLCPG